MHGREGENRKRSRSRHMWSEPTSVKTRTVAGGESAAAAATGEVKVDSFYKDARKIRVGDCALFKPPQDSPPFIGIIRWLTLNKDNILQLGVNWLYRPAEVKLGKGIQLEAAPNEVFYSFHKDEIPAASLLHPCKVAFLPKGVELPSGISSFVCRRVYDIANKCLWWLTDQNYIDERQEEVDQLLDKTRKDMHATVQPGRRSPKPVNGPTTTSQPKVGSDSAVKSRKRDRSDQVSDHVKREHSSKTDDCGSGQFKHENILRTEISKITDKGGLIDSVGVEKFVQLLQSDRAERRMELISRAMLAGVIAATDKFECLNLFVQLKGLSVLDGWLQDFHKGKIGDSGSKDGDKAIEDLLLVLLRALDKLPVNLHALQMCNIGKSVNHLRSHKNLEIQKKARVLVDTWKKRVEAEMNVLDGKSGSTQASSWPSRSRLPEVSHGGNRHPGGSADVATRSSITQLSAAKTISIKPVQGDITTKSASPPGIMRSTSSPASAKDGHPRVVVGSSSEVPSSSAREDRSSSSSQSPNNSQSRSSDHAKAPALSRKEDARSSTAGSTGLKMSSGTSRPRSMVNGVSGHVLSASPRESGSSRTLSHRNFVSDKLSPSGLTSEKSHDGPVGEGNHHKLIVKIPNRGRSPGQSISEGVVCEPSIKNSRPSSPVNSEKHDPSENNVKDKSDCNRTSATSDVNTESWQSNDFKDVFTASDEGDASPSTNPVKEQGETIDVTAKLADGSKATSSSSNELRPGRVQETSFCSINALIDSCVKYSEVKVPDSAGDDVGMNLLASVAAGEICDSELISPAGSPNKSTLRVVDSCKTGDAKLKSSCGSNMTRERKQNDDGTIADVEKQGSSIRDGLCHLPKEVPGELSGQGKTASLVPERTPALGASEFNLSKMESAGDSILAGNRTSVDHRAAPSVAVSPTTALEKALGAEENKQVADEIKSLAGCGPAVHIQDAKVKRRGSLLTDTNGVSEVFSSSDVDKTVDCTSSHLSSEIVAQQNKADVNEECHGSALPEIKPHVIKVQPEHLNGSEEDLLHRSSSTKDFPSKNNNGPSSGDLNEMDTKSCGSCGKQNNDNGAVSRDASVCDQKCEGMETTTVKKEVISVGAVSGGSSVPCPVQEAEQHTWSMHSKMNCVKAEKENCSSFPADASRFPASMASDMDTKPKFDLNEGFDGDDGKYESSCPAAIKVAAAAKGPFVPPEDLFRSNGQFGWKGSAATSAFRPAPRRVPETAQGVASNPRSEANAGKRARNLLDFDLNVPDERILEDMACRNSTQEMASTSDQVGNLGRNGPMGSTAVRSSGVLDFDLNRTDEASDVGQCQTSSSRRLEVPFMPVKLASSSGFLNSEVKRDFDLNSGPGLDDASVEPLSFHQPFRSSMQATPSLAGYGITNSEMGNFSSWFPSGHVRPHSAMQSVLSDREQAFPIVGTGGPPRNIGPHTSGTSFSPDVFRGSVLASSPAVPFPSAPFQYSIFPFGTNYSLPSAAFTAGAANHADALTSGRMGFPIVNSQLLGPSATVSSQFPRPTVVSLSEGGNNAVADNSRTWARHGLDLNAGPGSVDIVGREENMPLSSRQLSVASSQALAEEQARMLQQVAGGILKRKEPDGGWGTEGFRYKQSSWQ